MIHAVLFDAYGTLFDVYSVALLAEQTFPGKGDEISRLWRAKQIEYTHLRTLSGRYKNFWGVTRDALDFTLARLALRASNEQAEKLMNQYVCLSAFPESLATLKQLRTLGLPLGILSNGTPQMLDIAIKSAGMSGLFEHVLSVDAVRQYKTAPAAYEMGPHALGLPARQILFVSSNGWDAAGAAWFGYTTFWVNRADQPDEQLDIRATASGRLLSDVADFISSTKPQIKE